MRPAWMLRLGLFIYDHLGGRKILPPTRTIDLADDPLGAPLAAAAPTAASNIPIAGRTIRAWSCSMRSTPPSAARVIRTRTRCIGAERGDAWRLVLDVRGRRDVATARVLVNATGPGSGCLPQPCCAKARRCRCVSTKAATSWCGGCSTMIAATFSRRATERFVFALPFERDFTLIGTTDQIFAGDPSGIKTEPTKSPISAPPRTSISAQPISPADVVWSFAGVRSLYDDGSKRAQDVTPRLCPRARRARRRGAAAERSMAARSRPIGAWPSTRSTGLRMSSRRGRHGPWTRICPAANFPHDGLEALVAKARKSRPFLSEDHVRALVRAYGTRIERVLGPARQLEDLGACLGADLTAAEVRYLMEREWAQTEDDVLWRRSKLGLRFSPQERERLAISWPTGPAAEQAENPLGAIR